MHRNLLTLPTEMGGLAQRDIDAQCKVIQCSIIAKLHKVIKQIKVQTDLMLWHLNEYRNFSVFPFSKPILGTQTGR